MILHVTGAMTLLEAGPDARSSLELPDLCLPQKRSSQQSASSALVLKVRADRLLKLMLFFQLGGRWNFARRERAILAIVILVNVFIRGIHYLRGRPNAFQRDTLLSKDCTD